MADAIYGLLAILTIYGIGGAVGLVVAMSMLKEHVDKLVKEANASTHWTGTKHVDTTKEQRYALAKQAQKINRMRWATVYAWPVMLPYAIVWGINTSLRKDGAGISKIMAENEPWKVPPASAYDTGTSEVKAAWAEIKRVQAESEKALAQIEKDIAKLQESRAKRENSQKNAIQTSYGEWIGDETWILHASTATSMGYFAYTTSKPASHKNPVPWKRTVENGMTVTRDADGKEVNRVVKRGKADYVMVYPVGRAVATAGVKAPSECVKSNGFVKIVDGKIVPLRENGQGIMPLSTAEVSSEPDPTVLHVDGVPVEASEPAVGEPRITSWEKYLPSSASLSQAKGPDDTPKATGVDKVEWFDAMKPSLRDSMVDRLG